MRTEPAERRGASARGRRAVAVLVAALFVLHQDVWLWRDPRLLFGLPIGLTYHVAFCLAASLVLALALRWCWPPEMSDAGSGGEERE